MKFTSLAVITLLVLCCSSAFAASGTFALGFLSYDQATQFCDYETVAFNDPFAAGIHNLTAVCGLPYDAAMIRVIAAICRPHSTVWVFSCLRPRSVSV